MLGKDGSHVKATPLAPLSDGGWAGRAAGSRSKGNSMLKVAVLALTLAGFGLGVTVRAADGDQPVRKRPQLTEEQKKARKEIIDKYDTNKDGKLDAAERKAITAEDKEKLAKLREKGGGTPAKKKEKEKEKESK
jgi:hypothetical protein